MKSGREESGGKGLGFRRRVRGTGDQIGWRERERELAVALCSTLAVEERSEKSGTRAWRSRVKKWGLGGSGWG
jgi:hypothetical protein